MITLVLMSLNSCFIFKSNNSGGGGADTGGADTGGEDSSYYIVVGNDAMLSLTTTNNMVASLAESGIKAERASDATRNAEHLIVVGKTEHQVSRTAYEKLEAIRDEYEVEQDSILEPVKLLIYTDGKSIAIACSDESDTLLCDYAVEKFVEKFLSSDRNSDPKTIHWEYFDSYVLYQRKDNELIEKYWANVEEAAGTTVAEALKHFYNVYSDDAVFWLANLYEPNICVCEGECKNTVYCGGGGFYYSNSARDNYGFFPDLESTKQLLYALQGSGMLYEYSNAINKAIPKEMKSSIVRFAKSLQDYSDGYFYHPQWGQSINTSRRGRDLDNAIAILRAFGASPTYNTPNGVKGDGILADGSAVLAGKHLLQRLGVSAQSAAKVVINKNFKTRAVSPEFASSASLIAYLEGGLNRDLYINENSYSFGNALQARFSEIKAADSNTSDNLVETLINWLNSKQQSNGIWDKTVTSDYAPVNGIMKICMVYVTAGYSVPNMDKVLTWCIKAITTDEDPYAITDIRNAWDAMNMISNIVQNTDTAAMAVLEEFRSNPVEALEISLEKFSLFRRSDGSFGYYVDSSAASSQGVAVAVTGSYEGDVNATSMTIAGVQNMIFGALGLSDYVVPVYTHSDFLHFAKVTGMLKQVIKHELDFEMEESTSDENRGTGKYKDMAIDYNDQNISKLIAAGLMDVDSTVSAILGSTVFADVYQDKNDNCLVYGKKSAGDHNIIFYPMANEGSSWVFETDICVMGGLTSYYDGQFLLSYFMCENTPVYDPSTHLAYEGLDENEVPYYSLSSAFFDSSYIKMKYGEWHNIRIEVQDVSTKGTAIRTYVDNILVQKTQMGVYSHRDYITSYALRFRSDSSADSLVLLDNTYFGTVSNLYDDPAEPDIPEEKPVDYEMGGTRGNGMYYADSNKFTDGTIKEMKADELLSIKKGLLKGNNGLSIPIIKENDAFKLENSTAEESRIYLKKSVGDVPGFVFDTDIMIKNVSSTRSDGAFAGFYASKSSSSVSVLSGLMFFIDGNGRVSMNSDSVATSKSDPLTSGVWYNLRIVTDGLKTGSNASIYINGELLETIKLVRDIDSLIGLDLLVLNNATGSIYLDNTYIATAYDPDAPIPMPDLPLIEAGTIGGGKYYTQSEKYDGKTVDEVGTAINDIAKIADLGGNKALEIVHSGSGTTRYSIKNTASTTGDALLFESDIMLKDMQTTRSDNGTYALVGTGALDGTGGKYQFHIVFTKSGPYDILNISLMGVYTYSAVVPSGEWFNLRLEFDGKTAGSALRVYINGSLSATLALTGALSGVVGLQAVCTPNTAGSMYLDNTVITYVDSFEHENEGTTSEVPRASVLSAKDGANGILVFMHDDGSLTTMSNVDALLDKYGMVADLALLLSNVYDIENGVTNANYSGFLPYMNNGRWKLVSHSATHTYYGTEVDTDGDGVPDALVPSDSLMQQEVVDSRDILRNLFAGQRVLTFAYPGFSSELSKYGYSATYTNAFKELIADTYISGRRANGNAITAIGTSNTTWEELGALSLDYDNYDKATAALNTISTTGGLAIFYSHRVFDMTDAEIEAGSYANNSMSTSCLDKILGEASNYVNNGSVWNAHYEDAILYLREAQTANVAVSGNESALTLTLTDKMDDNIYNHALTVRVSVYDSWDTVRITQNGSVNYASVKEIDGVRVIDVNIIPDIGDAIIEPVDLPSGEPDDASDGVFDQDGNWDN